MAQSKTWGNKFTYDEAVGRAAIALLGHPFDYVKILIQLGYEPLPPYATKTLFGTPKLALPNVFTYLGYIRRVDGQFGWFRGVKYKIASSLIYNFVYINTSEIATRFVVVDEVEDEATVEGDQRMNRKSKNPTFSRENLEKTIESLMRETFCKFLALAASYPLHVMVIRSCAQFVGRETIYDNMGSGVRDILDNSGIRGLYAGFMPRFLYDVFLLWSTHGVLLMVRGLVLDRLITEDSDRWSAIESYFAASVNYILAATMYPFHVVSTVMACNGSAAASLEASALEGRDFIDWTECWKHLSSLGQLNRGSSLLWRYQHSLVRPLMFDASKGVKITRVKNADSWRSPYEDDFLSLRKSMGN